MLALAPGHGATGSPRPSKEARFSRRNGENSGVTFPRYSSLGVTIQRPRGEVTTGRCEIGGTSGISAMLVPFENGCGGVARIGVSGAVDFSRLDSNTAEGVLDLTLRDGSHVTGEFVASRCPPPPGISPLPDGGYPIPAPSCASLASEPQR
jgi:hypothetical protein